MDKSVILDNYLARYRLAGQCPYKFEIKTIEGNDYIWLIAVDIAYLLRQSTSKNKITLRLPNIVEGVNIKEVFRLYKTTVSLYLKSLTDSIKIQSLINQIDTLEIIGNNNEIMADNRLLDLDIDAVFIMDDPFQDELQSYDSRFYGSDKVYKLHLKNIIFDSFNASQLTKINIAYRIYKEDKLKSIEFKDFQMKRLERAEGLYYLMQIANGFDFQTLDFSGLEIGNSAFNSTEITAEWVDSHRIGDQRNLMEANLMFYGCKHLKRLPDLNTQHTTSQAFMYASQGLQGKLLIGRNVCNPDTNRFKSQVTVCTNNSTKYKDTLIDSVCVDGCDIVDALNNAAKSPEQFTLDECFYQCKMLKEAQFKNIQLQTGTMLYDNNMAVQHKDINKGKFNGLPNINIVKYSYDKQSVLFARYDGVNRSAIQCNMTDMFRDCTQLKTLDIENVYMPLHWVTLRNQFRGCQSLERIKVKNVLLNNTTLGRPDVITKEMDQNIFVMFAGCLNLKEIVFDNLYFLGDCDMQYFKNAIQSEFKRANINPRLQITYSSGITEDSDTFKKLRRYPEKLFNILKNSIA